jgi:steroid 5-alpha reductase family enzyme
MLTIYVIAIYFGALFIIAQIKKDNSIVDMAWGFSFVVVVWANIIDVGVQNVYGLIIAILVTLWGMRLSYHLVLRNWGKPEDFRYANWRVEWGKWVVPRAFLQVFALQGFMLWVISLPAALAVRLPLTNLATTQALLFWVGVAIWVVGYYFEVVGDAQLRAFKKDPKNKGKLIMSGLWSLTRHPNYFGEATMWWGIFVAALSMGVPWYGVISPVVITYLLRYVSGVPLLEKSMMKRPGFEEYAKKTPVFIPRLFAKH